MTRDIKDELLLVMLFLGFFFLFTSFVGTCVSNELPSPKAGADPSATDVGGSLVDVARPSSLLKPPSVEYRSLADWSVVLALLPARVASVNPLKVKGGMVRESIERRESCVPAVAACGVVANGLGLTTGASEG